MGPEVNQIKYFPKININIIPSGFSFEDFQLQLSMHSSCVSLKHHLSLKGNKPIT
jgi:hypothetical protein